MYRQWPFFRAMADNAELALAKSDLQIAERYAALATETPSLHAIASRIDQEFRLSVEVLCAVTEREGLLDGTPWLKESIRVRNRFIDPLNLIQVELMHSRASVIRRRGRGRGASSPDATLNQWDRLGDADQRLAGSRRCVERDGLS